MANPPPEAPDQLAQQQQQQQPIPPPIHLHVKILRPKECDIAWEKPIAFSKTKNKLGFNIRVFKEEYKEGTAIQDYSISTTNWNISNLEPHVFYIIHIYSMLRTNNRQNQWERSAQPAMLRFFTAYRQKDDKKGIPDPPENAREVKFGDDSLRKKHQKDNVILAWNSPGQFRGRITYKISWNNDLLGVTNKPWADLGQKNKVKMKFEYMHQQKKKSHDSNGRVNYDDNEYDDDDDDDGSNDNSQQHINHNDDNDDDDDDEESKYDDNNDDGGKGGKRRGNKFEALDKIELILKSQTFYKTKANESLTGCHVDILSPFKSNNDNKNSDDEDDDNDDNDDDKDDDEEEKNVNLNIIPVAEIKWERMYQHDREREQIVIWLYLETQSNDRWQVQPQRSMLCEI